MAAAGARSLSRTPSLRCHRTGRLCVHPTERGAGERGVGRGRRARVDVHSLMRERIPGRRGGGGGGGGRLKELQDCVWLRVRRAPHAGHDSMTLFFSCCSNIDDACSNTCMKTPLWYHLALHYCSSARALVGRRPHQYTCKSSSSELTSSPPVKSLGFGSPLPTAVNVHNIFTSLCDMHYYILPSRQWNSNLQHGSVSYSIYSMKGLLAAFGAA